MSKLAKTLPALATLGVSALFLAAPQPAQAVTEISCDAAGDTHFSPGVQMFPQSEAVAYRGTERGCIDHSDMGITSARLSATFGDVDLSCVASDFGGGTGTATIEWTVNGGKQTSTVDLTIDETMLNTAKVSGVVTKGVFEGQRFTGEFDTNLLGGAGKCTAGALFGGVKSAGFKGHFSIG
ncbi:hypothetical protein SAMN05444920_103659 [Nonomuraea solani]|uniref:Uncharacterized protein n=1 Tax=Nonomuraea solani TaxID=1144553 RepID=A0A1H6BUY9_9ACTN|nr:hypothetical protein [Nonomuraea solani]SEG64247.1 hypothetical protein SAMN05444920_103659 [Nonomuraea solani]